MADLLAIISHDRQRPVADDDVAGLGASYAALRGRPARHDSEHAGWVAVEVCGQPQLPATGIERKEGWLAWAGSIGGSPPAPSVPPESLEGQFSLVALDREQTLTVATDPLGLKPLFTAESDGRTYVSTSALALARHLRCQPSREGLEAFLCAGNQLGRLTPWQGIRRLGPAEKLTFTPAGVSSSTYWQPALDEGIAALGFAECTEACLERAVAALRRRFDADGTWVDLTGGFDSRLLALLSARAGFGFNANTSGEPGDVDVEIGRRVAARAGWPWQRIGMPADWPELQAERIDAALAWGDGHLDAVSLTEVMEGHRIKSERAAGLFNGGGGEHFRDFGWGHELLRVNASKPVSIDRLIGWRILGHVDLSALSHDPLPSVRSTLRAELEYRLEPFAGAPNSFRNDVLHAFRATDHFGPYQAVAGANMQMELPFYERSVFACSISAAPRHRALHRLMRAMIARLDPELASIETDTGGPAEPLRPGNAHRFAIYPLRRARKFAARLDRRLSRHGPAGPLPPALAGRANLVAALRDSGRLDPAAMRSAPLYDRDRLAALIETAATAPATVDWTVLGRIVTAELALAAADAAL